MKRERYSLWLIGCCLVAGIVVGALAASVSAQKGLKSKKFLTGPLTIEDQGSFFIGGVPKISNYAADEVRHSTHGSRAESQQLIHRILYQRAHVSGHLAQRTRQGLHHRLHKAADRLYNSAEALNYLADRAGD